jgi:hypothetical protein
MTHLGVCQARNLFEIIARDRSNYNLSSLKEG